MNFKSISRIAITLTILLAAMLLTAKLSGSPANAAQEAPPSGLHISGPFYAESAALSDPGEEFDPPEMPSPLPLKYVPGTEPKGSAPVIENWVDTVAQNFNSQGIMPDPGVNFPGMSLSNGGAGWPPDTNGDVGPDHYVQTVNTSIAVFNKSTGAKLDQKTLNDFFTNTGSTYCNSYNYGDPVVVYDRFIDRWVVTDFAFPDDDGPFYECLAVSKTSSAALVSTNWYMYAILINSNTLNDYPKIGVWRDGYYLSYNMFKYVAGDYEWDGVRVMAVEKAGAIAGALKTISFNLSAESGYGSLLPSHALSLPPDGAPNYFASVSPPNKFQLWEFNADWTTPANSTFTGPVELDVADFAIAASVPQLGSGYLLDSLSFRPMMQLIYRQVGATPALWMNHTVASGGVAGVRWYEVRDPGGTPSLFQQGTYQPDNTHRWMGSLAVDQDGNMAVGYSVSSSSMYPGIYYAGRLAGETPGLLTQAENDLVLGSGSQTQTTRWGDYSHMTVDPDDECTFWYTTEYYLSTGYFWQTRIGSFKFPTCGQTKATINGVVRDALTNQPIPGAQVVAQSVDMAYTTVTDSNGAYSMPLLAGSYDLTGGPKAPGYPTPNTVYAVGAIAGSATSQDILLSPVPYLAEGSLVLDDSAGLANGYPEPGESNIILWEDLENIGATTSTGISAHLTTSSPGVTIGSPDATYADIPAGENRTNQTGFTFSVDGSVACGTDLVFQKVITDSVSVYTIDFSINASIPLPQEEQFNNDVEGGVAGWTSAGTLNNWAITAADFHSPSNAWTDSPGGDYANNANNYLRTPAFDLSGKRGIQISAWVKYFLESGYDYVYLDYSLDGGSTWSTNSQALGIFNGVQNTWAQRSFDASILDGQPNVALRFHLVSDSGVTDDGIYIDDIVMTYEPFGCAYTENPIYLPLIYSN